MPTHRIHYAVFSSAADLPAPDQELLAAATAALGHSYSPYSNFKVAAAARLEDGTVVTGWNTENASYPMCLCAEPATLAAAASLRPGMAVVSMAITVKSAQQVVGSPASPCGACRQQLLEHETRFGKPMQLILRGETGPVYVFASAGELLPFGFSGAML
ncbi:cytidine deaminase [Neolewinella lacunae]|uniref:Cytidine deaminase n=1 Tax=Neolewinella lacunae TaxID=1517758 RepID=A0A923PN81_9BACT|nr:cytidine deaminase [Neolewinella lacunae]MBC6993622.1 cytidine deaminase [Neolewinella lacunae]MDN3635528.1 cytidine deaminase [Neolewinella lacunae]